MEEYEVFSKAQKKAFGLSERARDFIKHGEYAKGIEVAKDALSITKFESEGIYWILGDAHWRRAKST